MYAGYFEVTTDTLVDLGTTNAIINYLGEVEIINRGDKEYKKTYGNISTSGIFMGKAEKPDSTFFSERISNQDITMLRERNEATVLNLNLKYENILGLEDSTITIQYQLTKQ